MRDETFGPRPAVALRCREVLRRTGLSRATIDRLMSAGEFPQQHQLSRGRVGWNEKEIDLWIRQRLGDPDGEGVGP
jgi:prophage regulatory protein